MNKRTQSIRFAMAQINSTVGDISGNSAKIIDAISSAEKMGVDIIAFPELAVCGYPPEDLLMKESFINDNISALRPIALAVQDIVAVVGFVDRQNKDLYNSAAVIQNGKVKKIYRKMHLPNYGVFDEKRYFKPGKEAVCFKYGDIVFGVNICEDIWEPNGPVKMQSKAGARLIVNINASPFHSGKISKRESVIRKAAVNNKVFIAYTNLVGGQDELVFDGQSMVVTPSGKIISRAAAFGEELAVADIDVPISKASARPISFEVSRKSKLAIIGSGNNKTPGRVEETYLALKLALKDYVQKNGFRKVVIGLSGGIDSAIVAVLAVDALGPENVTCVFMPSQYSSEESREDAEELAKKLDVRYLSISIESLFSAYKSALAPVFSGMKEDITEENLQSRIRGNLLMALSNKFGCLVLTTGNKSEMSTGYATLYGDMAGGFAVIKDVPKILVYELSNYRNSIGRVIPERIITKAPTAELRPNQKDTDSLPPYEILDAILKCYVEDDIDVKKIIAKGFDKSIVKRVVNMVDKTEYKRRQSPPGIKITARAFGKDRRVPITNKYKQI